MMAFEVWRGRRPALLPALASVAAILAVIVIPRAALSADTAPVGTVAQPVTVYLDQAKLLKVPERTATLVIGNPLIADVATQPGGIMVVTAKSYGVTNVIAVDRAGVTLMEYPIEVVGPADNIVVVYRGVERESYSCMPKCERRIMLGDTTTYFTNALTQAGNLSGQAQGQPAK
jgi:Flp pilus assembly secretin CpaC